MSHHVERAVTVTNQGPLAVVHLLFSAAAAGTVRQALAQREQHDLVVHLHDNFSFGPIDGEPAGRARWVDEKLGITNWEEVTTSTAPFLAVSRTPGLMPVVWFSRRDVQSHAGFLWWLSHIGEAPCRVIDITEMLFSYKDRKPYLAVTPSVLSPAQMLDIIDGQAPLEDAQREHYQAQWRQLVADNAPLRVIDHQGSLVSAPITHFDPLLLSLVTPHWRKMSLIMAQAVVKSWEGDVHQTSDLLLHSRLCELAESGALEWRGDLHSIQKCELRLPG